MTLRELYHQVLNENPAALDYTLYYIGKPSSEVDDVEIDSKTETISLSD